MYRESSSARHQPADGNVKYVVSAMWLLEEISAAQTTQDSADLGGFQR